MTQPVVVGRMTAVGSRRARTRAGRPGCWLGPWYRGQTGAVGLRRARCFQRDGPTDVSDVGPRPDEVSPSGSELPRAVGCLLDEGSHGGGLGGERRGAG